MYMYIVYSTCTCVYSELVPDTLILTTSLQDSFIHTPFSLPPTVSIILLFFSLLTVRLSPAKIIAEDFV